MKELSKEERRVIDNKGTEAPNSGEYNDFKLSGTFCCRKCGEDLYKSSDKFDSGCGWPSFDDSIEGKVKEVPDIDGRRTEIICRSCGGHLGHVFRGENLTEKNVRYCVNSVSMEFKPDKTELKKAYFAGGCFWGVEHYMKKLEGVLTVISGYSGGVTEDPTYNDVTKGDTGHLETVEITYDTGKVSYLELLKYFMEIHDPTQIKRQGPDIGEQYSSAVFYNTEEEKEIAIKVINMLKSNNIVPATSIIKFDRFYRAEDYHQNYYDRKGSTPYCHSYVKRFT